MSARNITAPLAGCLLFVFSVALQACPVCFAAPESPESRGMTLGILFLLGTVATIICGIGSFAIYLFAKQKEPAPAHAELEINSLQTGSTTN